MPTGYYGRFAHTCDRMITKYGYHETSGRGRMFLRRDGVDRECRGVEMDFSPRDVDGHIIQRDDIRFLVSPKTANGPLSPPPDDEHDVVILINNDATEPSSETKLIFAGRPKRLAPAGVTMFWELHLRKE
jgi:hypothetical protein